MKTSEMWSLVDFAKGVTDQRADYATRTYSRAYDHGQFVLGCVLLATPVAVLLVIGFIAGYFWAPDQ